MLIPTPGQTEQEYLCARMQSQGRAVARRQGEWSLAESLEAVGKLAPREAVSGGELLKAAVGEAVERGARGVVG